MSPVAAACPGCGAPLAFRSAATLYVVCPFCGGASLRTDVDLRFLGKVATVSAIDSVLSKGAVGRMGARKWEAIGRIQLDHGKGPWNEWCLAFEDGGWAWMAEAQGQLLLTERVVDAAAPRLSALAPEVEVPLGARGTFVVAEIGEAKVTGVEGELPVRVEPGATVRYADLRGPDAGFGTLDYGAAAEDGDDDDPSIYVGRVVSEAELGIDPSSVVKSEAKRVPARRLACPKCAGAVDVKSPEESVRATCPSCGALLDLTKEPLLVLGRGVVGRERPQIPLGARGRLRGLEVEVYAFLIRSVRVEGVRYPWEEYLLAAAGGGWRWLVCSSGHWSFVEPAELGDVRKVGLSARHKGVEFAHFQGAKARVDRVEGEMYWEVAIGDEVKVDDFVAPPLMLSFERTEDETVVSVGAYLTQEEVVAAFALQTPLRASEGVGAIQPNPYWKRRRAFWSLAGGFTALVIVLMIVFHLRAERRTVLDREFSVEAPVALAAPAPPAPETERGVAFSDEFTLTAASANLRIDFATGGYDNLWAGLDGALVNLDTGDVHAFEVDAERWSGVSEGEAWREGDGKGTVHLGRVPAGRYSLRLEPVADPWPRTTPASFQADPFRFRLKATSQVASTWRPLILALLLLLPAVFVSIAARSFEKKRWAESDHPWTTGGDDDDE